MKSLSNTISNYFNSPYPEHHKETIKKENNYDYFAIDEFFEGNSAAHLFNEDEISRAFTKHSCNSRYHDQSQSLVWLFLSGLKEKNEDLESSF